MSGGGRPNGTSCWLFQAGGICWISTAPGCSTGVPDQVVRLLSVSREESSECCEGVCTLTATEKLLLLDVIITDRLPSSPSVQSVPISATTLVVRSSCVSVVLRLGPRTLVMRLSKYSELLLIHGLSSISCPNVDFFLVRMSKLLGVLFVRLKRLPVILVRRKGCCGFLCNVFFLNLPFLSLAGSSFRIFSIATSITSMTVLVGSCNASCSKYGLSDISISLQRSSSGIICA
jgi:hypothetical protein